MVGIAVPIPTKRPQCQPCGWCSTMLNADEVGGSVTQAQGLKDTTLSKANCSAARVFAIIERVQLTLTMIKHWASHISFGNFMSLTFVRTTLCYSVASFKCRSVGEAKSSHHPQHFVGTRPRRVMELCNLPTKRDGRHRGAGSLEIWLFFTDQGWLCGHFFRCSTVS